MQIVRRNKLLITETLLLDDVHNCIGEEFECQEEGQDRAVGGAGEGSGHGAAEDDGQVHRDDAGVGKEHHLADVGPGDDEPFLVVDEGIGLVGGENGGRGEQLDKAGGIDLAVGC